MRTVLLLVASTLVALGLAEGGLHLMRPLWAIPWPPVCLVPHLFQQWDPYGYRLWPSKTQTFTVKAWSPNPVTITANADGFRDRRELAAGSDGRPRLQVFGDSMVFGIGVEEPERFTERLEAARPGWRVDNVGMVGYGPDLMLRAFEAVGLPQAPRAALVVVFTDDLRRVVPFYQGVGFPLPRFALRDGQLVTEAYPTPTMLDRVLLVQGVQYLRWRYTDATFPLNAAILDRFAVEARAHGIRLGLAFAPGPKVGREDVRRRDFLAATAAAEGVPFVDLTPALQALGAARAYLPNDTHWTAAGHGAVADTLGPWLAATLMQDAA